MIIHQKLSITAQALIAIAFVGCGTSESGSSSLTNSSNPTSTPTSLAATSGSSASHNCSINSSGGLYCWGYNGYGQLGNGNTTNQSSPELINSGTSYAQVTLGLNHTCAITTAGVLQCWGVNTYGRLGIGNTTNESTPTTVNSGTSYTQVAAGAHHTCAITSAGVLQCWGCDTYGELGDGAQTQTVSSPQTVDPGTNYSLVSTGTDFTCGITTAGVLKCWGYNGDGQLGNGTSSNPSPPALPTVVDSGTTYSTVSTGVLHTCGVTTGGALKCWGDNSGGELGNGTKTSQHSPVVISSSGYSSVSTGEYHTCAITTGSALKCWGTRVSGQVGDGQTTGTPQLSPKQFL